MRYLLLSTLLLAGCALPPVDHTPAAVPTPPLAWTQPAPAEDAVAITWWSAWGSAELDALIARAHAQSHDLAAAAARLRQAEAVLHATGAARAPTLDGSAAASRTEAGGRRTGTELAARYELDLWGRLDAGTQGAQALLRASRHDADALRLLLTARVAEAWLQAVGARERHTIAERSLASAERLLQFVAARARAGAATALELAQQRGLVATQRRSLAALRTEAAQGELALALLLGQAQPLAPRSATLADLRAPGVALGLPAELLPRRPDIARAEAQLAAAQADVATARAALLPRVTFSAALLTGGARPSALLDHPAHSLAAALATPLFDGRRLRAQHAQARARRDELLAQYRGAIAAAFLDVEAALAARAGADAQASAQADAVAQAERALGLAEARWRAGGETLLVLIDAQRSLYAAQLDAAQLQQARLASSVRLHQALGGGWGLQGS